MAQRYPQLQKNIAALRNAMITGVAGTDASATCLKAEEGLREYVTCEAGAAPAGDATALVTQTTDIVAVDDAGTAGADSVAPADVSAQPVDSSAAQDASAAGTVPLTNAAAPIGVGAGVAALAAAVAMMA